MLFRNNAKACGQAQACTLSRFLGGKKRIVNTRQYCRGYPWSIVLKFDRDAVTFSSCGDRDLPFFFHRVDGVVEYVRPYLVKLASRGGNFRNIGAIIPVNGNSALEFAPQNDKRILNAVMNIDLLNRSLAKKRIIL